MRALILIADGFEDSEFFYPYYRLLEEGIEVDVAGPQKDKITGKHGYEFEANVPFAGLNDERQLFVPFSDNYSYRPFIAPEAPYRGPDFGCGVSLFFLFLASSAR